MCDHSEQDGFNPMFAFNEDVNSPKHVTLQEAINFLYGLHAQVLTTLNELKFMDQKLKEDICCYRDSTTYQLDKIHEDERYANKMFCKIRARIFNFMEENRGITF